MSLAKALRRRREINRNRRALDHAIAHASPALRDDLIIAAQRAEIVRHHH